MYRKHVKPVFGDMTLAQVANDRDGVMDLLAVTMKHLSNTPRQQARHVIVGTVDEAVKAGKLSRHRLDGIELADSGRYSRKSFVFPTYEQVKFVADGGFNPDTKRAVGGAGLCVWLMRGCGLRIEEALAVCKEDFIEDGTVLRVAWQASGDGKTREPLKHRKAGEYRDVPVPSWLWEMVEDMPDGPLIPGTGSCSSGTGRSTSGSCALPRSPASRTGSRRTRCGTPSHPRCSRVACRSPSLPTSSGTGTSTSRIRCTGTCCPLLPREP